jgi:hypothetical protein
MKRLTTLKSFKIYKIKSKKFKTYIVVDVLIKSYTMDHSHAVLIWPDGNFKSITTWNIGNCWYILWWGRGRGGPVLSPLLLFASKETSVLYLHKQTQTVQLVLSTQSHSIYGRDGRIIYITCRTESISSPELG